MIAGYFDMTAGGAADSYATGSPGRLLKLR